MVDLKPSKYHGVFTDGRDFFTPNLVAGTRVYGEKLLTYEGREFRRWDPYRSKLAALLQKGCHVWPFDDETDTLYLGAASGTTVSHLSDLCTVGKICCIEISPRVFRKLLDVASKRPNMLPFLGDADHPEIYARLVSSVDVLYQDIAQKSQLAIFQKNLRFLKPGGHAFLMVKARSMDVAAKPSDIFNRVLKDLLLEGVEFVGLTDLKPFEKDHAAITVRKPIVK